VINIKIGKISQLLLNYPSSKENIPIVIGTIQFFLLQLDCMDDFDDILGLALKI
jgi:hypothetical protein